MKLNEVITLPIDVGDEILTGKFKNKKTTIKDISYDEKGQLMINGKKALTFRIAKLMKQENEMKLGSLLNEATNFSSVKKGDIGEDYAGHKVKIIDKAVGKRGFKKLSRYDDSGAMEDFLDSEEEFTDVEKVSMVAVEFVDGPGKGDTAVFTYGDDGVTVDSKSTGAIRSKKSKKLMKTKFSQVMRGDTGEDYGGEKFVVLAKASPGKFKSIEKYDSSGMMADTIGEEGDDFDMVAVQYDKGKKKAVLVFDEITIFW